MNGAVVAQIARRLKAAAKGLVLATVLAGSFHATTWTQQWLANREMRATSVYGEFKREFGISLNGHKEDIEVPGRIADIAGDLRLMGEPDVQSIHLLSQEYLKQPVHRQFLRVVGALRGEEPVGNYGGYVDKPLLPLKRLEATGPHPENVILHELAHARIDSLLRSSPGLADEWLRASGAKAELYHPISAQARIYMNFEDNSSPEADALFQAIGFNDKYSTTNWQEDAAEMIADGERAMRLFYNKEDVVASRYVQWLVSVPNKDVITQIGVLQRHGLLPAEFSAGIALQQEYREVRGKDRAAEGRDFLKKSEAFLKAHPQTKYEAQVRYARGKVYWELAKDAEQRHLSPWPNQEAALAEWLEGTKSPLKDRPVYLHTLSAIADYAYTAGDKRLETLCRGAVQEYDRRHQANDVRLARTGVQEYLAEHDGRFR